MGLAMMTGVEAEIRAALKKTVEQELNDQGMLTPEAFAALMDVFPSGAEVLLDQLKQNSYSTETLLRIADALRLHVELHATRK